jgi:hypothetical protein
LSFGSDPGWDDGGPANIVIPDDARELDRDLLAYRRELRSRRRRERLMRLLAPLRRLGLGRHGAMVIAACVALSMVAGVLLSAVAVGPASAPTVPPGLARLPSGTFTVEGASRPVRGLRSAALALVPPDCGCDQALQMLAQDSRAASADLYFVGEGRAIPQIPALTARDGGGAARAAADPGNVLAAAYRPSGLTVVLVYSDGTSQVSRGISVTFPVSSSALRAVAGPGR